MSVKFNIDEIFEMAEQIERNGQIFYRHAGNIMPPESESQKLMLLLADMEIKHEKIFADMRKDILNQNAMDSILNPDFDPDGLAGMYLRAIVDGKIFNLIKPPDEYFTENETAENLLKSAIQREKDAIIFYLGIKESISKDFGQDKVDLIIKEEMSHITYISNEIKRRQ
ncbi:MAG: ferritin family protein [Candidatus Poribacteria bacterium]